MSNTYEKLIIDGNNLLYRAFFSKKKPKIVRGLDVGPIYRALHMLKNLVDYYLPKEIYFTWDKRLNPNVSNFRKELYPEYKANRVESEDREKIHNYCEILIQICDSLGIKTILPYDLEADDVINYLISNIKYDEKCLIVSSDRDLLQLVNDNIHQLLPLKNIIVNSSNFEEYAGCQLKDFLLYKAIMGDTSDNIAGLNKFGIVRARTLAEKINEDISVYDELTTEQKNIIQINLKIMDLHKGLEYRPGDEQKFIDQLEKYKEISYDGNKFVNLTEYYGLGGFRRQLGEWNATFNPKFDEEDWLNNITM